MSRSSSSSTNSGGIGGDNDEEVDDDYDLDAALNALDVDKDYELWTSFRSSSRKSIGTTTSSFSSAADRGHITGNDVLNASHTSSTDEVSNSNEEEKKQQKVDPSQLELDNLEHWRKRVFRDEVYSHRYKPSQGEQQELNDLIQFLGMSTKKRLFEKGDEKWNELIVEGEHSMNNIVLKRGFVLYHGRTTKQEEEERELILVTHGFLLAQVMTTATTNALTRMFVARTYQQCELYHAIEYVRSVPTFSQVVEEIEVELQDVDQQRQEKDEEEESVLVVQDADEAVTTTTTVDATLPVKDSSSFDSGGSNSSLDEENAVMNGSDDDTNVEQQTDGPREDRHRNDDDAIGHETTTGGGRNIVHHINSSEEASSNDRTTNEDVVESYERSGSEDNVTVSSSSNNSHSSDDDDVSETESDELMVGEEQDDNDIIKVTCSNSNDAATDEGQMEGNRITRSDSPTDNDDAVTADEGSVEEEGSDESIKDEDSRHESQPPQSPVSTSNPTNNRRGILKFMAEMTKSSVSAKASSLSQDDGDHDNDAEEESANDEKVDKEDVEDPGQQPVATSTTNKRGILSFMSWDSKQDENESNGTAAQDTTGDKHVSIQAPKTCKKFVTRLEERHCFIIKTETDEFHFECATEQHKQAWLEALERVLVRTRSRSRSTTDRKRGWQHALVQTSLHSAAVTGFDELCRDEWLDHKDELDSYNQLSPLHYATMNNFMHIMDYLLSNGADPEVQDEDDRTPMYYAQRDGLVGAQALLLDYGAKRSRLCDVEERGELFKGAAHVAEEKAANSKSHGRHKNTGDEPQLPSMEEGNDLKSHQQAATQAHGAMNDAMNELRIRGEKINELSDKANQLEENVQTYGKLAKQLKAKAKKKKWYNLR